MAIFNCYVSSPEGIYEAAFPLLQDTLAEQLLEQTAEEEEVPCGAINTTEKANQTAIRIHIYIYIHSYIYIYIQMI